MTKNDIAWDMLFQKHNILSCIHSDGFFRITAKQINEYREARLMTKFDHKSNLPKNFVDNHLSILPVTRGDYIIAPMKIYNELEIDEEGDVQFIELPANLQSLDPDDIRSEAAAISCAYASGILEHFLGEEITPTVNGRMSSESFSFKVQNSMEEIALSAFSIFSLKVPLCSLIKPGCNRQREKITAEQFSKSMKFLRTIKSGILWMEYHQKKFTRSLMRLLN